MAAIVLTCAPSDYDKAHDISRLLMAEGDDVRIAFRPEDYSAWKPEAQPCTVVLWSRESKKCWAVLEMARAARLSGSVVQVALEPVTPPIPAIPAPIDFSRWGGERTGAWRLLRERIEHVGVSEEHTAKLFFPTLALTAASITLVGFSIGLRMEDGPAPTQTGMTTAAVQLAAGRLALPDGSAGGPTEEESVWDDIEVRQVRMQPLRPGRYGLLPDLDTPHPLQVLEFRRHSILGQVLDRLPFIGDTYRGPSA